MDFIQSGWFILVVLVILAEAITFPWWWNLGGRTWKGYFIAMAALFAACKDTE